MTQGLNSCLLSLPNWQAGSLPPVSPEKPTGLWGDPKSGQGWKRVVTAPRDRLSTAPRLCLGYCLCLEGPSPPASPWTTTTHYILKIQQNHHFLPKTLPTFPKDELFLLFVFQNVLPMYPLQTLSHPWYARLHISVPTRPPATEGQEVCCTYLWKWKVSVSQSCPTLCNLMDCSLCSWNSPDENTGVGCHALFQGLFLTQGLNPGLLHCRQILYHLSHQGSPFISLVLTQNPKYSGCSINIGCIDRWETEAWYLKVSAKSKFTGILIFKLFILCWGIVDKQCCDSFRKTAKEFCRTYTVSILPWTPLLSRLPCNTFPWAIQ